MQVQSNEPGLEHSLAKMYIAMGSKGNNEISISFLLVLARERTKQGVLPNISIMLMHNILCLIINIQCFIPGNRFRNAAQGIVEWRESNCTDTTNWGPSIVNTAPQLCHYAEDCNTNPII